MLGSTETGVHRRGLHKLRRDLPDERLAALAASGDSDAFEQIFNRHHQRLLAYCRHTLANSEDADDAIQQTFISAHRSLLEAGSPRELLPWLYAIARNKCRDIRAKRVTVVVLSESLPLEGLSDPVQEREDLRLLLADVARLPEQQRSALLLAEIEGMAHRSIAQVIDCSEQKVRALIHQARKTLLADRSARDASCHDIREQLSVARAGELRRGPLRRHLSGCDGCRQFATSVRDQRAALGLALPVIPGADLLSRALGATTRASAAGHVAAGGHALSTAAVSAGTAGGGAGAGVAASVVTAAKVAGALALSVAAVAGVNAIPSSPARAASSTAGAAAAVRDADEVTSPVGSDTGERQPHLSSTGLASTSAGGGLARVAPTPGSAKTTEQSGVTTTPAIAGASGDVVTRARTTVRARLKAVAANRVTTPTRTRRTSVARTTTRRVATTTRRRTTGTRTTTTRRRTTRRQTTTRTVTRTDRTKTSSRRS